MNEENKNEEKQQNNLDLIATALQRKKKRVESQESDLSIHKLYETMTSVIQNFDESIYECKKFNEAKVHRKYEVVIDEQQKKIHQLHSRLMEEQRVRSPSKRYIEELLNQLVEYKDSNKNLILKNEELDSENSNLKKKLEAYECGNERMKKEVGQKDIFLVEISGNALKIEVDSFLKLKYDLRKYEPQSQNEKSKFEKFLTKYREKLNGWNMRQFLENVDQWSIENSQRVELTKIDKSNDIFGPSYALKLGNLDKVSRNLSLRLPPRNLKSQSNRNFPINSRSFYEKILR